MALARERDATAAFLERLAQERQGYDLPPRLHELSQAIVHHTLELLFPHFAAEVGGREGDVREELTALRDLLADALRMPSAHCCEPESVADSFIAALPRIREALLLDAQAICDGDPAAQSVDEVIIAYPGFLATAVYRIAHQLHGSDVPLVPRVLTEIAHRDTGIDIHPGARIGAHFAIDHGTGIVIGETAELGERVKLYQGVTLGALSVPHKLGEALGKRHPTLEDGVTIYSGATILGGDTVIGRGAIIGGNVWIVRSVPPGAKVFGRSRGDSEPPPAEEADRSEPGDG